jgi:hypothetical protein
MSRSSVGDGGSSDRPGYDKPFAVDHDRSAYVGATTFTLTFAAAFVPVFLIPMAITFETRSACTSWSSLSSTIRCRSTSSFA